MKTRTMVYAVASSLIVSSVLLVVAMWCPWLSEEIARDKAIAHFEQSWENSSDGCYLECEDCGATAVTKVSFGRKVALSYQCGWEGDVITKK